MFAYNTPTLAGFDTYSIGIWMDFGLIGLVVRDASEPPPVLSISGLGGNAVALAWSTNSAGYRLESAGTLPGQGWSPVVDPATLAGDRFVVTLEAAGTARFYRLAKP